MAEQPKITDAQIQNAYRQLEVESRDLHQKLEIEARAIEQRKTSILAYLHAQKYAEALEKKKAELQAEIATLKNTVKADTEAHAKNKEGMLHDLADLKAEYDRSHAAEREADQKELAGLKKSIANLKKQAADAEKDSQQRIAAANESIQQKTAETQKLFDGLHLMEQEKRDKIAALDEEFRSLAQKHGLGAAVNG